MMNDRHGLSASTDSQIAHTHYLEGLDLVLSQNYGAEDKFLLAIESDQGFALAHIALAFVLHVRVAVNEARESADTGRSLTSGITRREQQHIEILARFVHGDNLGSYALVKEHLAEFPADAFLLRMSQRLFVMGCGGIGPSSMIFCLPTLPQRGSTVLSSLLVAQECNILRGPYLSFRSCG